MKAETKPTAQQLMKNMNFWSCIFVIGFLLMSGEAVQFTDFVSRHPTVVANICLLALAGAIGQLFIFLMVSDYTKFFNTFLVIKLKDFFARRN